METTQEEDGECDCPLCEDYSGAASSVEAHISRKTDDAHKGEVGRFYRDELESAESGGEEADPSGDFEGEPELDEEDRADVSGLDVVEDESSEDGDDERAEEVVDDETSEEIDGDDSDDEPPGAGGVEVVEEATEKAEASGMGGWAVVIATIGLVAVALFGPGAPTDDESEDEQQPEEDDAGGESDPSPDDLWGE